MNWVFALTLAIGGGSFLTIVSIVGSVFRDEWKIRRNRLVLDRFNKERRARIAALPKGKIIKVGVVEELEPGLIQVSGWLIVYPGNPHSIVDGQIIWSGYSTEELREIAARKSEFEP